MNSKRKAALRQGIRAGLHLLYPPRCPMCDQIIRPEDRTGYCPSCRSRLTFTDDPICLVCGKKLPPDSTDETCGDCKKYVHVFDAARSVYLYEGGMKTALYRFKYSDRRAYAEAFAKDARDRLGTWILEKDPDAFIPVPMYRAKERKRGYNQAEVFARALGHELGIPVDKRSLIRIRNTPPQKTLSREERRRNLISAFQYRGRGVVLKRVFVIDDIYTTGTTADACAQVLKSAGIGEVYVLCIANGRGI